MRMLPWLLVLGLLATPVFAADKKNDKKNDKNDGRKVEKKDDRKVELKGMKNAPSQREIERATTRARFMNDRSIRRDYKDGRVLFTPADLGGLSDEQMASGFVLGFIETDRKTESGLSGDGSNLRRFAVYAEKSGGDWKIWYTHAGEALGKSLAVDSGLDDVHPPVFQNNGRSIWYWRLKFDI